MRFQSHLLPFIGFFNWFSVLLLAVLASSHRGILNTTAVMTQGMLNGLGEKKNERENECQPDRTRSYRNIILANNENLNLIFKNNFEINKCIFFCFRFFYQNQYNIGSQSNTP